MMMTRLGLTTRLLALLVLGSEAARALQEPHRGASAVLPLEVALPVAPVRLSLGALLNATADNASAPTRGGLGAEPGVLESLQAVAAQAAREVVEVEEEEVEEETYYYNSSAAFAGSNATGAGPARRPLPAPSTGNFTYLGCWYDGYPQSRDLGVQHQRSHDDLTPARCVALCSSLGHAFAAVQFSKQCFCSDEPPGAFGKAAEAECDWPCTGDAALACGGRNRNSVYFRGSAEAGL